MPRSVTRFPAEPCHRPSDSFLDKVSDSGVQQIHLVATLLAPLLPHRCRRVRSCGARRRVRLGYQRFELEQRSRREEAEHSFHPPSHFQAGGGSPLWLRCRLEAGLPGGGASRSTLPGGAPSGGTLPEGKTAWAGPAKFRVWARCFRFWRFGGSLWRHWGSAVCTWYQAYRGTASLMPRLIVSKWRAAGCPAQSQQQLEARLEGLQRASEWHKSRGLSA